MDVHNGRSPEQWEIISKRVDFADKSVIDLGCGYGDILAMCRAARALEIGIERDERIAVSAMKRYPGLNVWVFSIEDVMELKETPDLHFDVSICFSVLPYLDDPDAALDWMRTVSGIALIECQYHGDGPGPERLKNDDDMRRWLEGIGWKSVEPIGKNLVKIRNLYRTIWMCR